MLLETLNRLYEDKKQSNPNLRLPTPKRDVMRNWALGVGRWELTVP